MHYYPFGETRWVSGTVPTDRLFTGQRAEANIGLYDYNARMYSPSLGRFISADTIVPSQRNPQSVNRYSYVIGNPVNHIDPTGHDCDDGPQTYKACYSNEQNSNSVVRAANTPNGSWTYSQVRAWKLANGRFDAVAYILSEIQINSRSNETNQMRFLNQGNDPAYKLAAMRVWYERVSYNHIWDHKPFIRELSASFDGNPYWQEVGTELYSYDTWSNIHYGYVGRAAGFDTDTLLSGASIAQAKNELITNRNLPPYYANGNILQNFDPTEDRNGILLGARLWEKYGVNGISPNEQQFIAALQATPGLNRR